MNSKLMREFEELEGLSDKILDELPIQIEDTGDEDLDFKPANATAISSADVYYEMDKRGLKSTGFPDTDREILQKAFDEEFKTGLEDARAKKREKQRKAAQQLGLQKRRMLMEKTLQQEQEELAKNHQVGMVIELIKENLVGPSLRIDVNSISARSLAKAMWVNNSVTCLDLSSNDLNDHAGCYLARILKRNNTLKKLELDNNMLGPKSFAAFGESLIVNTTLVYLSLDSNPVCTEGDISGIKSVADALRMNTTLISLNLWRTGMNSLAGTILANGFDENGTILFCDIGHNRVDMSDVKRITEKLDENLVAYEMNERKARDDKLTDEEREKRRQDQLDEGKKQKDLAQWLEERRNQRAKERRAAEEERIRKQIEDAEEKKRLTLIRAEEERKAAEEAAAKKAKKKAKDKGKK